MSLDITVHDPRIEHILEVIMQLAAGNLAARGSTSEHNDDLDAIITGLNILAEEREHVIGRLREEQALLERRVQDRTAELTHLSTISQEQHAIMTSVLHTMVDGVIVTDHEGNLLISNPAAKRILGMGPEDADPYQWLDQYGAFLPDQVTPFPVEDMPLTRTLRGEASDQVEFFIRNAQLPQGKWMSVTGRPLRDDTGQMKGAVLVFHDITEHKQAEVTVLQANAQLRRSVHELEQRTSEIKLLSDMGELLQSCLTTEEAYMVIQRYLHKLFPSQAGALYLTSASRNLVEAKVVWGSSGTLAGELLFTPSECWALRRGRPHVVEDAQIGLPCRHAGPTYTGSYLCAPMMAQGEALGILHVQYTGQDGDTNASLLDTTQRLAVTVADQVGLALANLALRETLRNQSIRDPLTGLFNRRYLEEALDREVLRATRSQGSIGIIMLDIDHFKHFNDTFGHAAGDTLLREMGTMLKSFIRGGDIACRYGGEEFILVLPEATRDVARARAEELREKIRHLDVEYRGQALANITLSLGIAAFPDHGQDQDTLLRLADNALYHAKREGRNRVVVA